MLLNMQSSKYLKDIKLNQPTLVKNGVQYRQRWIIKMVVAVLARILIC